MHIAWQLACVSWKDRMMTTGCRLLVMNRSLIWAFTSVSPATCRSNNRVKRVE